VTAKRAPVRYAALGGDCSPTKSGKRPVGHSRSASGAPAPVVTNGADSPRVLTYDDWLQAPPNADTVEEVPVDPLGAAGVPGRGGGGGDPPALGARAWLTADCPVPASTVFSLLDLAGGAAPPLAAAGRLARRLCAEGLLPVKLSVPLLWTLRVKLSVSEFVLLDGGGGGDEKGGYGAPSSASASSPSPSAAKAPAETNDPAALAASLSRDPRAFFDLPARCRRKTVQGLREARRARASAAAAAALAARRAAANASGRNTNSSGANSSHDLNRQASRASDGFPMSPLRDGYDDFEF
jgi:hypothetical protein